MPEEGINGIKYCAVYDCVDDDDDDDVSDFVYDCLNNRLNLL